jgi:diguanylate cyclase (GGDEF)-like protein/PAS domain S-box-containing protein/putative nucleotidyltransferase with HDIG domain
MALSFFNNWIYSTKKSAEDFALSINEDIYDKVYSFVHLPYNINEAEHKIIKNGMLDLSKEKQRDRFFVGVLESQSHEIYSFSYGTVDGWYYGARRNENNVIEIMKNDDSTKGYSWYYSVNEDMTAKELALIAGKFDPRTRLWYQAAAESGKPTFSPIYKHFVMDDLTVSCGWPVYNENGALQGVLGTHLLLSDIGSYLQSTVNEYNGFAIIIEKTSNQLIANSMGKPDFKVRRDGTIKRSKLSDIACTDIENAYEQFKKDRNPRQVIDMDKDHYFTNFREIHMNGIDWIIISAIPESFFLADVYKSITEAIFIAVVTLILTIIAYNVIMRKYLNPMNSLLQISKEISLGNLSKRVNIVRDDEIGLISKSFNQVADKMQSIISNLESTVDQRTEELRNLIEELEEKKDELSLILDSSAEGIFGTDLEGNCMFCNTSALKMLGYTKQEDLLGQNMHRLIHHTMKDGTPYPIEVCKIISFMKKGEGLEADDEVFWRADGTSFDVEYHSYPQIKNEKIIGAVVTFMDITERKKRDDEIKFLSNHDVLTGLFNRRYFESNLEKIDIPENLPLSVIFADINGLKMTNDIFGHTAGDKLIKKSSEILKNACRQNDILARVGGDEFIILLPNTTAENCKKIISRIKEEFLDASVEAIKCSISLGQDTKTSPEQSLQETMTNAEDDMYKDKTMNRKSVNRDMISNIIKTLHGKSQVEKEHSYGVSNLCAQLGSALGLSETEINKLKRAGYLHDIGKIVLDENLLRKEVLTDEEAEKVKQHSAVGYRILNLFDDTLDLAEYVYSHHEKWDGTGYPRGLKGEQIPLISRIIAAVELYDRVLNSEGLPPNERKLNAIESIRQGSGTYFDPKIVDKLIEIVKEVK